MKIQTCLLACLVGLSAWGQSSGLVVHEWGTFTSLQDETGASISGINSDDEPVPKFVHRMANLLLLTPTEVPPSFFQGAPRCHPDVTMRLETPVIYFHAAGPESKPASVDVRVKFRGGWLTEFFPDAEVQAPGFQTNAWAFGPLPPSTVSELAWKGLKIGGHASGPATLEHVWTAPRAVQAEGLQTENGEREQFLFYRGVGNISAPLRLSREADGSVLSIRSQLNSALRTNHPLAIHSLWLTEIQPDGEVAFRERNSIMLDSDTNRVLATVPTSFRGKDFSKANMAKLRAALKQALMAEGLFADEAEALLNTWELSYFKSPGLRLFFLVPHEWTDYYLPLEILPAPEVRRVMMGRIELVTPLQRKLLQRIAAQFPERIEAELVQLHSDYYGRLSNLSRNQSLWKTLEDVNRGQSPLASLNILIPPGYRTYLDLGRFRNALLLDEEKRRPARGLKAFIEKYGLDVYKPPVRTANSE